MLNCAYTNYMFFSRYQSNYKLNCHHRVFQRKKGLKLTKMTFVNWHTYNPAIILESFESPLIYLIYGKKKEHLPRTNLKIILKIALSIQHLLYRNHVFTACYPVEGNTLSMFLDSHFCVFFKTWLCHKNINWEIYDRLSAVTVYVNKTCKNIIRAYCLKTKMSLPYLSNIKVLWWNLELNFSYSHYD